MCKSVQVKCFQYQLDVLNFLPRVVQVDDVLSIVSYYLYSEVNLRKLDCLSHHFKNRQRYFKLNQESSQLLFEGILRSPFEGINFHSILKELESRKAFHSKSFEKVFPTFIAIDLEELDALEVLSIAHGAEDRSDHLNMIIVMELL